jgi:hypothetical protein
MNFTTPCKHAEFFKRAIAECGPATSNGIKYAQRLDEHRFDCPQCEKENKKEAPKMTTNTCPTAQAYEAQIQNLEAKGMPRAAASATRSLGVHMESCPLCKGASNAPHLQGFIKGGAITQAEQQALRKATGRSRGDDALEEELLKDRTADSHVERFEERNPRPGYAGTVTDEDLMTYGVTADKVQVQGYVADGVFIPRRQAQAQVAYTADGVFIPHRQPAPKQETKQEPKEKTPAEMQAEINAGRKAANALADFLRWAVS